MAESPDVCGQGPGLILSKLCSAHGRHRAAIFLGFRNTVGNHFQDSAKAAVAP